MEASPAEAIFMEFYLHGTLDSLIVEQRVFGHQAYYFLYIPVS